MANQTIQLQSVGKVPAVPASELKAGDVRMYNFGSTGLVVKVIEKTSKTLQLIMFEGGKYYVSDIRKETLVSIVKRDQDVSSHQPKEAYKVGRNKGMMDVSEFFQIEEVKENDEVTKVNEIVAEVEEAAKEEIKIPVKSITFEWSEASHIIKDNTVFSTFEEVNSLVYEVAADMVRHNEQGYRKTSFIIEWADGRKHEGRIDIQGNHLNKHNPIGQHVKYFYESLAGLNCPADWTYEEYKDHLKYIYKIDDEGMKEMKRILDTYLLEDVTQVEEPVIDSVPTPNENHQTETSGVNVTVKMNEQLNGIELYFASKPSEEIREQLKANGYRWSKRGFWYAKQTEKALSFANSLNGIQTEAQPTEALQEPITYPDIDINDLDQYTVSDELQRRLHSASMFEVDYKKDCANTFQYIQSAALEVLALTDNPKIQYQIKSYLQSYKKRYYDQYLKILNHRANNPSWAVTGRGGMNVRRYNKMQDRYSNMLNKASEMDKEFKNRLNKFKDQIIREEQETFRADLEAFSNTLNGEHEFITETREIDYMGITKRLRTYSFKGFTIVKTWGCYRVFKNGKELKTDLKTTSRLEDAKKYVLYLHYKSKSNA